MTTDIIEEQETTRAPASGLRVLYNTSLSLQKLRIGIDNRVSALEKGFDKADESVPPVYARISELANKMEGEIDGAIADELERSWPVYTDWLCHVRGIGPSLSGAMLSLLLPPLADRGPSTWYKAAGLYVEQHEDGTSRIPRPHKGGGKVTYHIGLRVLLYNVATSFVRLGGYYREAYDRRKERLFALHMPTAWAVRQRYQNSPPGTRLDALNKEFGTEKVGDVILANLKRTMSANDRKKVSVEKMHEAVLAGRVPWQMGHMDAVALVGQDDPDWPLFRVDSVARWSMIKLFLAHLYEKMLECDGLGSGRRAYVIEQLGHGYIPPPEWDGEHLI